MTQPKQGVQPKAASVEHRKLPEDQAYVMAKLTEYDGADGRPGKSPAQGTTLLAAGPLGVIALVRARQAGLGLTFTAALTTTKAGGAS